MDYYKLVGKRVVAVSDIYEWARWYEKANRRVAQTVVGPLTVSTIFLGMDHGYGERVELFETMVFGARDHLIEIVPGKKRLIRKALDYQCRYATWDKAEAGHAAGVEWAKAQLATLDVELAGFTVSRP